MTTPTSFSGREIVNCGLLTALVDISQSEECGEKFHVSLLNMKEFLTSIVEAETATSQQIVPVLKRNTESRSTQTFATIFAVTDDPLLRNARSEQMHHCLRASMAVQT